MKTLILPLLVLMMTACAAQNGANEDSQRLTVVNQPVPVMNLLGVPVGGLSLSIQLNSVITPPTVNGSVVQASDVLIDGTTAYVTYNVAGDTQTGAIDQIQSSVLTAPILSGSKHFDSTDINTLTKSGNSLFAVGSDVNLGAALYRIDLSGGMLSDSSLTQSIPLRSFGGTGVVVKGSTVYTTSGDGTGFAPGGIDFFDSISFNPVLTNITTNRNLLDLRSISYNPAGTSAAKTDSMYVVSGKSSGINSTLYEYADTGALLSTTDLGLASNTIPQSKSSLAVGKTMVAVSLGDNGFKIICAKDKSTLVSVPRINETPNVSLDQSVTNSITMAPGLIFAANGGSGIYVYSFSQGLGTVSSSFPCGSGAVTAVLLGKINLGVNVNNVKYQSLSVGLLGVGVSTGTLYAATSDGFKLLSLTQTSLSTDISDF